jgi:KDO2-lipid IV(A) lauroyltransferase
MNWADLCQTRAFAVAARFAPGATVVLARLASWLDGRATGDATAAQLETAFRRAFPDANRATLAALRRDHRASLYQGGVLLAHLRQLDQAGLRAYARKHVHYLDVDAMRHVAAHDGPVVLITPHYGAYLPASLRLIADVGPRKRFNVFFDDPADNASTVDYEPIYRRFGGPATVLYNNRRAVVAALKALQRGEVLTMMPDVYDVAGNHVAVPFLGGLTHAMTGTAFFALRANALLVPVYCHYTHGQDCVLDVQRPIPLSDSPDPDQALYETTAAIFANMEAQLRRRPAPWIYWSELERRFPCATRVPCDGDWAGQFRALLAELRPHSPLPAHMLEELARRADALGRGRRVPAVS